MAGQVKSLLKGNVYLKRVKYNLISAVTLPGKTSDEELFMYTSMHIVVHVNKE